ncbi:MAG: PAS domain S-box protein [Spirochaetaceae bacterium]|nr:PAS domain S-box protein [Spirochaetaceae bacterium]
MKTSIFRKNLILIIAAILIATCVFVLVAIKISDTLMIESSSKVLLETTRLAVSVLETQESSSGADHDREKSLAIQAQRVARSTGYRVTLIGLDGRVIADSDASPHQMENHLSRAEVRTALSGKPGTAVRKSSTTGVRMLYAAIPFVDSGNAGASGGPTGMTYVVRLAMPLVFRTDELLGSQWLLISFILFVAVLSVLISIILNRQLTRPIAALQRKAESYALNSGTQKLPPLRLPQELKPLDASLDLMVEQIRCRSRENEELGRRYSSILEAAGEGIVAVDSSLRIIETNPAFLRLFSATRDELTGKTIIEAIGEDQLAELFRECLASKTEVFSEISIFHKGEQRLKVHASPFSQQGSKLNAVAVISDITELNRLEKIRTDFVANVSHELRTPIQIIHGYAEILLDDKTIDDDKKKYLSIIENSSKRMERIVNDLLTLSRIEGNPSAWLTVENCSAEKTIRSAIASIQPRADQKNITVNVTMDQDLSFIANQGLIEQALVNLLDNALHYSPAGSQVDLWCREEGPFILFGVKDKGVGIPAADLEHIFERFYRVDKSHNRNTGGTGLGLAIVKHIVGAHEGEVKAKSYVQEGSEFTIRLPVAGPRNALRSDSQGSI